MRNIDSIEYYYSAKKKKKKERKKKKKKRVLSINPPVRSFESTCVLEIIRSFHGSCRVIISHYPTLEWALTIIHPLSYLFVFFSSKKIFYKKKKVKVRALHFSLLVISFSSILFIIYMNE